MFGKFSKIRFFANLCLDKSSGTGIHLDSFPGRDTLCHSQNNLDYSLTDIRYRHVSIREYTVCKSLGSDLHMQGSPDLSQHLCSYKLAQYSLYK